LGFPSVLTLKHQGLRGDRRSQALSTRLRYCESNFPHC